MSGKTYLAIDLKSFYASVECAERGLDALYTNLVVADESRTSKTICLAVSPSLKAYGIGGRARLFEVIQRVQEINAERLRKAPGHRFTGKSYRADELLAHPELELDFIIAPPQMKRYMEVSTEIYNVYLKYIAPEDIHVYSIDEVFIDATSYLDTYKMTGHELAIKLIREVLYKTRITATAGVATNMYLAKVAMDVVAKHIPADRDGVRIAELDERKYRELLWDHQPLTDFWRVGRGISGKLQLNGMFTMGDVARCSVTNEDLLYKLFGINAELLIDHAWGYEPCTIREIKAYRPESSSLSSGQVLSKPYPFEKARVIVREMSDSLVLSMVEKHVVSNQMVLYICYDSEGAQYYKGPSVLDYYGRRVPKPVNASVNLPRFTSASRLIGDTVTKLYDEIVDRNLMVRRIFVIANHVIPEDAAGEASEPEQLDMFTDYEKRDEEKKAALQEEKKERSIQQAMLELHKKYGKNSVVKAMDLKEDATKIERNNQVGGHKA